MKFILHFGISGTIVAALGLNFVVFLLTSMNNLYLLCLRYLLVSFYNFISDRLHPARGIIVAEARGKREDDELRTAFQKIYYYGVSSIKPTQFRRIILDLFIVPKTQDYVGTQLADMIVYPVYDGEVPNHSARKDHFINFDTI